MNGDELSEGTTVRLGFEDCERCGDDVHQNVRYELTIH